MGPMDYSRRSSPPQSPPPHPPGGGPASQPPPPQPPPPLGPLRRPHLLRPFFLKHLGYLQLLQCMNDISISGNTHSALMQGVGSSSPFVSRTLQAIRPKRSLQGHGGGGTKCTHIKQIHEYCIDLTASNK